MNIVYIVTNSYIPILGISITSLLENTSDIPSLNLHILSTDINEENKKKLEALVSGYNRSISFYDIAGYEKYFSFAFQTSGFHSIVLARLLLEKYLPATLDCVLYLDSDIIIHNTLCQISELEQILLQSTDTAKPFAFAAVPELCMPELQKQCIGLTPDDIYYNCGVLLINLKYWRQVDMHQRFLSYYASMQGNLLYNDQDILNHCCRGEIYTLSHNYNFTPALYYFPRYFIRSYQPAYYCHSAKEYQKILKKPAIIHFLGEERPWYHGNFNPYRKVYEYYKCNSPWKDEPLIRGKELTLFLYHILNLITSVCPWFRKLFTKYIGIYYYKLFTKK